MSETWKIFPSTMSAKKTAGYIGLIFFVSAVMFVLGVLVGRGTAPVRFDIEKLQKELIALKEAVVRKEKKQLSEAADPLKNKLEFDFYEALKKKPDPEEQKRSYQRISPKSPPKSDQKAVKRKKPKQRVPTIDKKTTASTNHPFGIQVAAVKDDRTADKLVTQLKKKGYPAFKIKTDIPGKGMWCRVRIGYFKDKSQALAQLARLKQDGLQGFIVTDQ